MHQSGSGTADESSGSQRPDSDGRRIMMTSLRATAEAQTIRAMGTIVNAENEEVETRDEYADSNLIQTMMTPAKMIRAATRVQRRIVSGHEASLESDDDDGAHEDSDDDGNATNNVNDTSVRKVNRQRVYH